MGDLRARKGDSKSTTFNQIQDGTFPPPVKLSQRMSAWPDYEVDAINAARLAHWSSNEIRVLVSKLVELRETIPSKIDQDIRSLVAGLMANIKGESE